MKDKKIVMVGCLEVGWELVSALLEEGVRFDYFVSISKTLAEKNVVSGYQDFADLAQKYNVPIYYAESYTLKAEADLAFFKEHKFDLLIQGGWQRLFPDEMLQTLSIGAIGIHGSSEFLPKGRGRSPQNWSLIEGKKRFIIHLFMMKPGVDDGDVFDFDIFDINEFDTIKTLYYKNFILTKKMLLKNLSRILDGTLVTIPQVGEPSYYPKRTPEDGIIDWSKTVYEIYNFVRALTHPYPGAFAYIGEVKITLWEAQVFDTRITYPLAQEGQVVEVFKNGEFVVNCNSGLLLVRKYDAQHLIKKNDILQKK